MAAAIADDDNNCIVRAAQRHSPLTCQLALKSLWSCVKIGSRSGNLSAFIDYSEVHNIIHSGHGICTTFCDGFSSCIFMEQCVGLMG